MQNIGAIINTALQIYSYMIIVYILMSWFNAQQTTIGQFLGSLVEPYLAPFRRFIPPIGGMLDISPIVAILALNFAKYGVYAIFG